MNDPYLDDYDAYLNSLNRFNPPERKHIFQGNQNKPPRSVARLIAGICVFLGGAGAIFPWIG